MLKEIREYLYWTGADCDLEDTDTINLFQTWVDYLDEEIGIMEWFIKLQKENDDE
tara:strand:- start:217 stop:381 length:165 start_codon:yes stop_codon:yes gene_type:complete